jgi:hypothetical protein
MTSLDLVPSLTGPQKGTVVHLQHRRPFDMGSDTLCGKTGHRYMAKHLTMEDVTCKNCLRMYANLKRGV